MDMVTELNHPDPAVRMRAAAAVGTLIRSGSLPVNAGDEVNNHVHTSFSFSPYQPAAAAFAAYQAGLKAVGIMDHDSVGGCAEFIAAAAEIGIASTCGFELRVHFTGTAMEGRKLNNPDSCNIGYMAIHGIPKQRLADAAEFLKPLQRARNLRNQAMVQALNAILIQKKISPVDYQKDVEQASEAARGGAITERHVLAALARKLIAQYGKGPGLVQALEMSLDVRVPTKIVPLLSDAANPHYLYDLLGILKSVFLERIFIQPNESECISVHEAVAFGNRIHAIPVYAYLGDVGESPTGDKKAEKFEDGFLDELMVELKRIGMKGLTYMPPRNTREQILRIQALCRSHGFMEISGVDINSSRQSFNCPIILQPEFRHLITATWALIAHEKLASQDEQYALFNPRNPLASKTLSERIDAYAAIGKQMNHREPDQVLQLVNW